MLPFCNLFLLYLPQGADPARPRTGEWMFEIDHQADSGYPYQEETEPDPTQFGPPEKCKSVLHLRAWYCTRGANVNWYNDVWNESDWPKEQGTPVVLPNLPIMVISKSIELSELGDKLAVESAVADFKAMLTKHFGLSFTKSVGRRARSKAK
jgi:hypothetical protein